MLQPGGEPDLPLETFRTSDLSQLRMEGLERSQAIVLRVTHEIDRGHAPAPEPAATGGSIGGASLPRR